MASYCSIPLILRHGFFLSFFLFHFPALKCFIIVGVSQFNQRFPPGQGWDLGPEASKQRLGPQPVLNLPWGGGFKEGPKAPSCSADPPPPPEHGVSLWMAGSGRRENQDTRQSPAGEARAEHPPKGPTTP